MWSAPALANSVKSDTRKAIADRRQSVPIDCRFDLAAPTRVDAGEVTQSEPAVPRGTDLREIAWNPPAVTIAIARDGPVLSAGALGKTRKGVPGLAHVALGWEF